MKTTFDLPEPLLREAKSLAARQGRPLRDLVADAIAQALQSQAATVQRRSEPPPEEWAAFLATLERQPDGSYVNPNGIDAEEFFKSLDDMRADRLSGQVGLFEPAMPAPARPRKKA
jgi:hypothetical protein